MSAEVAQVLRDALTRLDGGKQWLQGDLYDNDGRMCSLGALDAAFGMAICPKTYEVPLRDIIKSEYAERVPPGLAESCQGVISSFNDHPATTFADVERVFEKAIANADEA